MSGNFENEQSNDLADDHDDLRDDPTELEEFEELPEAVYFLMNLDKYIHEPSRLAVLTILRPAGQAEYTDLARLTGLSGSVIEDLVSDLRENGLVEVVMLPKTGRRFTTVLLLEKGWGHIESYYATMERNAIVSGETRSAESIRLLPAYEDPLLRFTLAPSNPPNPHNTDRSQN